MIATLTASARIATGTSARAKRPYEMRESEAMRMFCGLPVGVATLPTLEEVASARRYGFGSRFTDSHTRRTSGVKAMHTTSLIRSAESTADVTEMAVRS